MSNPALVLIGGWGAKSSVWAPLEEALQSEFDLRCIELRDSYGGDAETLCRSLADQIPDQSYVVGWSLGGMLALRVAKLFPAKVRALACIAANACFTQRESWPSAMSEETFQQFRASLVKSPSLTAKRFAALQAQGHEERKAVSTHLLTDSLLLEGDTQKQLELLDILARLDLREDIAALAQPMFCVFGEQDALVPASSCEALTTLNKYIELWSIPSCGHAPQLSHSQELAARLLSFFLNSGSKYLLDKRKISASFDRAAPSYDQHAGLQRTVAKRLCRWPSKLVGRVLDLGCGTGYVAEELKLQDCIALDIAPSMLRQVENKLGLSDLLCADMEHLPLADASVDTVVSSLAIQWCSSLDKCFLEVARVLKPGGQWIFSSLGPETLVELEQAWKQADDAHVHVNRFHSSAQVMSAAECSDFELQLCARERELCEYDSLRGLMRDLKGIGAHNLNAGSNQGLTGRQAFAKLEAAYECWRNDNGKVPASYDVHYWVYEKAL